jgi:drug/metabolite transporter (DMT)-like permease
MEPFLALAVLISAALHPVWNASVKRDAHPEGALLAIFVFIGFIAAGHVWFAGYDFMAIGGVWPWLGMSWVGLTLYSTSLSTMLRRGDLSAYYPIARSSPLFIVVAGFLFLGESYSAALLVGITLVLAGALALQYRRGTRLFDDPKTLMFALLAMSGMGIYTIADARIMQVVEPPVLMVWIQLLVIPSYVLVFRMTRGTAAGLFTWVLRPLRYMGFSCVCYVSYILILWVFSEGGDAAAVASVRQASIPFTVLIGGLWLKEQDMGTRLAASLVLGAGIVVIVLAR